MKAPDNIADCHVSPLDISNEQFIAEHLFVYMIAGDMTVYDGNKEYRIREGDYYFARRNYLVKYVKRPPDNGTFQASALFFDNNFLQRFGEEYGYKAGASDIKEAVLKLSPDPLLAGFVQSLSPYLAIPDEERKRFFVLKKKELLLILLRAFPELQHILFDFSDPGKIDLKEFMNHNFRFNVSLERFSYLSGRSLTTFKRDFEKIFNTSPGRWLLEKRLKEAHFLIERKGANPSDVYLEVGFEDLSHFSFAFKKMYGVAPSLIKKKH